MDAADVCEFVGEGLRRADDGGEALVNADFVVGEIRIERDAAGAFFGGPKMAKHFADAEGAFGGAPGHVLGTEQREDFLGARTNGEFLLEEKLLQRSGHAGIIRQPFGRDAVSKFVGE